jgi:hypothetical protein
MSKNFKTKTVSSQSLSSQLKRSETKPKDLIERAKEELEKERERKRLRTLYKTTKTKESTSNTICSMSTNGSDISYISTNSFQKEEQQQYFSNNIIDYSKSSRENLYLITQQLNEILNMNNKKKSNTK